MKIDLKLLRGELERRGWDERHLAAFADLSVTGAHNVIVGVNCQRRTVIKVANALKIPAEKLCPELSKMWGDSDETP